MSEPRVFIPSHKTDIVYHEFECSECGKTARNTYCEPYRTNMLERRLCWYCNCHRDTDEMLAKDHGKVTIIGGRIYGPGNRTSGEFRGMAGRRFDIEYIEPSDFAGKRITTFDLWAGSDLPDHLRAKYADTARFLGGASSEKVGETTCWNQSKAQSEPYPLPRSIGIGG